MHRRFFFWTTLTLLLVAIFFVSVLTGGSFFAWPLFAQAGVLFLFVLFEPHIEGRLSPFYRQSRALTALAGKSQSEWTDLAHKTATVAMTRTVEVVDRVAADPRAAAPHNVHAPWKTIVSPAAFPGVTLLKNGDLQIGLTRLSTARPIQCCVNGVAVESVRDPEHCLRLSREGFVRLLRFTRGEWQIAKEPDSTPAPVLTNRPPKSIILLACLAFPALFGLFGSMDYANEGHSLLGTAIWFTCGAAAGLYYNWSFVNRYWLAWRDYINAQWLRGFDGPKNVAILIAYNVVPFIASGFVLDKLHGDRGEFTDNVLPRGSFIAGPFLAALVLFLLRQWRRLTGRQAAQEVAPPAPRAVVNAEIARQMQSGWLDNHATPVVPFGGLLIPLDRTLTHFALVGTTRSGKTVNMRLLMQAAIPNALAGNASNFPAGRAVVFDPKTEFIPILRGMGVPADRIKLMNPFDKRGVPWDIAGDTLSPADADNVAEILVPEGKDGEKNSAYFVSTSREIVSSVIQALHFTRGRDWTLRDFVHVCGDYRRLEALLAVCPATEHVIPIHSKTPDTYGNIMSSLQTIVRTFRVVAACWHRATEKPLSMNEWMHSNSVLVLGHNDTQAATFATLNRCLIHKISHSILDPTIARHPEQERTWIFLDEARDLGKMQGIRELLTRGASKGCTVVLGFQSINGMKADFGENEAHEIVGQCGNLAVFHLGNDHETAKWAGELIGKFERVEYMKSITYNDRSGQTHGTNEQLQERFIIRPEALQALPPNDLQNGLNGIFVSQAYGVIYASHYNVSGHDLFAKLLDPVDATEPALVSVDKSVQTLAPWSPEEQARLLSRRKDEPPSDWMGSLGRIN